RRGSRRHPAVEREPGSGDLVCGVVGGRAAGRVNASPDVSTAEAAARSVEHRNAIQAGTQRDRRPIHSYCLAKLLKGQSARVDSNHARTMFYFADDPVRDATTSCDAAIA